MAPDDRIEDITEVPATVTQDGVELLPVPVAVSKPDDPFLVAFNEPHDPENPLDWPSGRKWAVTDVISATGLVRIMVSTIMAPALTTIASELDMNSTESAMALSIYLLATAFGPLLIGPLSEIYGRQRVLHASNIWFLIWNIACGFANTKGLLIASRFLAGFGASAIYALSGGVLGDVWRPEQRGTSLGMYLLIPLLGAAVGPIIGGFMAARTTWRWMFWSTSIFQAFMIILSFTVFQETYAPLILRRRAQKLRKRTGDGRYYTASESLERGNSVRSIMTRNLSRPIRLLVRHPVVQITSILQALSYGILYIVLSTFSQLWTIQYGESVEISGLHYIACAAGEIAGSQLGGPLMDYFYRRVKQRNNDATAHDQGEPTLESTLEPLPESRLPLSIPGIALTPLAMLLFGWAAEYHLPWPVVDLGVFLTCFGLQIGGIPVSAYVIDVYKGLYSSSALAAQQFPRSLAAFCFPLFGPTMYATLGYGWGNSLLALMTVVVIVPCQFVLWRYGGKLRAKTDSGY